MKAIQVRDIVHLLELGRTWLFCWDSRASFLNSILRVGWMISVVRMGVGRRIEGLGIELLCGGDVGQLGGGKRSDWGTFSGQGGAVLLRDLIKRLKSN